MILALAARQVAHAAPAFNADFYTVAATVIPVLFLAIAVQGHIYDDLITAAKNAASQADNSARNLTGPRRTIAVATFVLTYIALIGLCIAIVLLGFTGEALSIQALYNHGPAGKPTLWALWAVILLTAAVVLPPFLRFALDPMTLPDEDNAQDKPDAGIGEKPRNMYEG